MSSLDYVTEWRFKASDAGIGVTVAREVIQGKYIIQAIELHAPNEAYLVAGKIDLELGPGYTDSITLGVGFLNARLPLYWSGRLLVPDMCRVSGFVHHEESLSHEIRISLLKLIKPITPVPPLTTEWLWRW